MRNRTTTAIKRHFYETEHRASATRYLCLSAGTNGPHTPNQPLTDPAIAVPRTYYRDGREPAIGRAHVCPPVTNAHIVCRLLLEKKNKRTTRIHSPTPHTTYIPTKQTQTH